MSSTYITCLAVLVFLLPNTTAQEQICVNGETRLADGGRDYEGRVELCYNGEWGTVCDQRINDKAARVVCAQLDLLLDNPKVVLQFGGGKGLIHIYEVDCMGNETNLLECKHSKTEVRRHRFCLHLDDVGVSCVQFCRDGEIRLLKDRVQICHKQAWGYICAEDGWDRNDASVVCRELGLPTEDALVTTEYFYEQPTFPYFLKAPNCSGLELNFTDCHLNYVNTCKISYAAIAYCSGGEHCSETGTFRLREFGENLGRLEMCYDGYWGSVCNDHANHHTADIACMELGYKNIISTNLSSLGEFDVNLPNIPIVLDNVECTGSETSLLECPHNKFTYHSCVHYEDIVLECTVVSNKELFNNYVVSRDEEGQTVLKGEVEKLVGGAIAAVIIVGTSIISATLIYYYLRRRKRQKRVERVQNDILASYRPDRASYSGNVGQDFVHVGVDNQYTQSKSGLLVTFDEQEARTRLNSFYLRELTHGKLIIKSEELSQLENIGQGEFGIVYRARLRLRGAFNRKVAVKTLKGTFDQHEVDRFVEESLKMSRFKHPHVMGLIGVCLDSGSAPYIVMPYMANGSLLEYMKRERNSLVFPEGTEADQVQDAKKRLMVMCSQITSGMEYLAAEKYIHRDLAARNCMIDTHFVIKITDFGLSEDVFMKNYYREGVDGEVAKLPFKWMAPESLSDGHFSEKSDVWSYGVTMWEIFSGGKSPYPGTNPINLIQMLEEGERMSKPYNAACTKDIYMMMTQCWEAKPENRPSFKELYGIISAYIEGMAGYLEMSYNPFSGLRSTDTTGDAQDEGGLEAGGTVQ